MNIEGNIDENAFKFDILQLYNQYQGIIFSPTPSPNGGYEVNLPFSVLRLLASLNASKSISARLRLTISLPGVLSGVEVSFEGVILSICKVSQYQKDRMWCVPEIVPFLMPLV